MKIIVSFTSYPPRIGGVHKVVESLYRQTVKADEIILYLSLEEFPNAESDIPIELKRLIGHNGFRIKWVQNNLKSHKKYYYALQEYKDDVVITVDDDTIYAQSMIKDLVTNYQRFPNAVSARRVRIMLKNKESLELYRNWKCKNLEEFIDVPRMDSCAIGVGGICYPPAFANEGLFDRETMSETAADQDDLWLKYIEIMNHIPVVYTKPSQKDVVLEDSQKDSLSLDNLYGGMNDPCARRLLAMLKAKNPGVFQEWFQNLMDYEEYIRQKKRYYADAFNVAIDRVGNAAVYFYGAGKWAEYMLRILSDLGVTQRLTSVIVSELSGNPSMLYGLQVRQLADIDKNKKFGVIFGVNPANRIEIEKKLAEYDYQSIELDLEVIGRYY